MKQIRIWVDHFLLWLISYPILSKFLRFLYSQPISYFFLPLYCKWFDVCVEEAEKPLWAYRSLRDFFCRHIQMEFRPIDKRTNTFTSPVDGVIIAKGEIRKGQLLQVKGSSYSLQSLLDSTSMSEAFQGGNYLTIYMSPGKYHRVHASTNGLLVDSRSIKGKRFPVNRFSRLRIGELYPRNERLISYFHSPHGLHSLVMVGSCQVGSVQMTNPKASNGREDWYQVEKGQEIAWFDFGSTVILLWPKGRVDLAEKKQIGDEVLVGEIIATAIA